MHYWFWLGAAVFGALVLPKPPEEELPNELEEELPKELEFPKPVEVLVPKLLEGPNPPTGELPPKDGLVPELWPLPVPLRAPCILLAASCSGL